MDKETRSSMERMAQWLLSGDEFIFISHVSPDGDTIGSALALYGILSGLGKKVRLCCDQPVPKVYRFLPFADRYEQPDAFQAPIKNVISVDCADRERMGQSKALFEAAQCTGNIDHHRTQHPFGDYCLHDAHAAATGELIYSLWCLLEKNNSESAGAKEIATCLFTALCTDTGSFAYTNTRPETFRIAAALLTMGVDTFEINREVFRSCSIQCTRLKGYILSHIELYEDGRIAYIALTREDLERYDTASEEMEGMIDYLRDVDTVEIAVLLRLARDNTYKISFRSKKYADVSAVAAHFGGGGHLRAAGCVVQNELPMDVLKEHLLCAAKEALH